MHKISFNVANVLFRFPILSFSLALYLNMSESGKHFVLIHWLAFILLFLWSVQRFNVFTGGISVQLFIENHKLLLDVKHQFIIHFFGFWFFFYFKPRLFICFLFSTSLAVFLSSFSVSIYVCDSPFSSLSPLEFQSPQFWLYIFSQSNSVLKTILKRAVNTSEREKQPQHRR